MPAKPGSNALNTDNSLKRTQFNSFETTLDSCLGTTFTLLSPSLLSGMCKCPKALEAAVSHRPKQAAKEKSQAPSIVNVTTNDLFGQAKSAFCANFIASVVLAVSDSGITI